MRFPIDRRAWPGFFILLAAAVVAGLATKSSYPVLFILLVLAGHLLFFRDFERAVPPGDGPVSPADGMIAEIATVSEERFLKEEAVKVGIFLSIFVPHVNRAPVAGAVHYLRYEPGKFLNALKKESVNHNESNWIGIAGGGSRVLVRQIAGAIARRIRWDIREGQAVGRGERLGIICYGSRVECFLPKKRFRPTLKVGQPVKAGVTIMGEWLS